MVWLLLFACVRDSTPIVNGAWSGTYECEEDQSGWQDRSWAVELMLTATYPGEDCCDAVWSREMTATDSGDSPLYYDGAQVTLSWELWGMATAEDYHLTVTANGCSDYTILVDGVEDPATCDDISWDIVSDFLIRDDGNELYYESDGCSGYLTK